MTRLLAVLVLLLPATQIHADTIPIPRSQYTVVGFSSENSSHPVSHAIDGFQATYWELNDGSDFPFPGYVDIDLGDTLAVNGFNYRPAVGGVWERLVGYEVYLSLDGINWGSAEAADQFTWMHDNDFAPKAVYFGAVEARFVRMVYTSSFNSPNHNIFTAELFFYRSTDPVTGMENQTITFEDIPKQYADAAPFEPVATASSGLPVEFEVVSGPAVIDGSTLSLTGEEGEVILNIFQQGNEFFYPVSITRSFEVVDLNLIHPQIHTSLTEDFPLEMASGIYAYPIYIHTDIAEPDLLSIEDITLTIDGNTLPAQAGNGYSYFLWTPSGYGTHEVSIHATANNGNVETLTHTIQVVDTAQDHTAPTLDNVVIEFGGTNSRWYEGMYTLPQHVGSYDEITARLNVTCPAGNCDDWDRLAYFEVLNPEGNWIEIIRYITPFGIACNHSLDVTDYSSLLQGNVRFRVFIDTWGTGGWELTLNFEHSAGTPEYPYSEVAELWDATYDFGNPSNLQPVDTVTYNFHEGIESSHLRLSTTGHGWGANNSQNAAEFFNATHYIDIDYSQEFVQHLWNTCNPNPDNCNNQLGTWQYNRGGWCPGAISPPDIYPIENPGGTSKIFTYRFHPGYQDYCHPENPNCNSGITCPDCNDGYNPHYVVDGQLINFSYAPIIGGVVGTEDNYDHVEDYRIDVHPNPAENHFRIRSGNARGKVSTTLYDIRGVSLSKYVFGSPEEMENHLFSTSDLSPGVYFVKVQDPFGSGVARVVVR